MEEEEPEKLGALKKAYADIILNTAKEAAARIMVSERKAYRFQQELSTAKQDSLNMLLRLKQITDSKISVVETVSVSQRRRIEELEVQLCKAQNMVTDLRTQLSGVHDELEKTKNKESAPSRGDLSKYNTSGPRSASTSDTKDTLLVRRNVQPEAFRAEKCYADKPDLDSLIMRSKEPEHYRNGCTQRIRAFDRNLSNGKSPLHAETKNLFSCRKKESFIREEASVVGVAKSFCKDENVGTVNRKLRKLTDLEELSQQDISCENGQSDRFLHKFCSRKKRSRYRTARPKSFDDQVMQPSESSLSRCKTHHCEENSTVNPAGDRSRIVEDDAQKAADACSTSTSLLATSDVNERDARTEPLSVQKFPHEDEESTVKLEFSKHGTEVAERSGVSKCKVNPDNIDIPRVSGITEDKETCEATNPLPAPTRKDMPLKYTFQRKRKKGALICPDENKTLEKETAKEKPEEIENIVPESQKSCLIDESPRDNRRLVLVARQLISLSEKRWR